MRACPLCNFILNDYDSVCPKCKGKGLPTKPPVTTTQHVPPPSPSFAPAPSRVNLSGVGVGIVIGAFALACVVYFSPGQNKPTIAPTPAPTPLARVAVVPTVIPTVATPAMPTPKSIRTTPASRPQSAPRQPVAKAPVQLSDISFLDYANSAMSNIRGANNTRDAARLALDYDDMSRQAHDAANVAPSESEIKMWSSAANMFDELSGAATQKLQYLRGEIPDAMISVYSDASETRVTTFANLADGFKPR